jgi:hypothetical protein
MRDRYLRHAVLSAVVLLAAVPGSASALGGSATTVRMSVRSDGGQVSKPSSAPSVSADGQYVLFSSPAMFTPRDTNGVSDAYLHIRSTGQTWRVSVTSTGQPLNRPSSPKAISAHGEAVLFDSQATNLGPMEDAGPQVYLRDRVHGTTRRVNFTPPGVPQANDGDFGVDVSSSGRYATWQWTLSGSRVLYFRDMVEGVSEVDAGEKTPLHELTGGWIARNGEVVFYSVADKLYLWSRITGARQSIPLPAPAQQVVANDISEDGRFLLFTVIQIDHVAPSGPVIVSEVYRRDRETATTTRVSTGVVPFSTIASGNSISANGRYVAFESRSPAFAPGEADDAMDLFVRDLQTGQTVRAGRTVTGADIATYASSLRAPVLSASGNVAVFNTWAAAVPSDTNHARDVYLRGPLLP